MTIKLQKQQRLSQNFSFGKATLNLYEKAGFRPLFRKLFPKLTEFWEKLNNFPKTPVSGKAASDSISISI
jgi:hypothetical protein